MNDVMRIVKEEEPEILEQSYDMDCRMALRIRKSMMPKLRARLEKSRHCALKRMRNVSAPRRKFLRYVYFRDKSL